jgi:hypothetical protein
MRRWRRKSRAGTERCANGHGGRGRGRHHGRFQATRGKWLRHLGDREAEGRRRWLYGHAAAKRPRASGPAHIHDVTCADYRALKDFDAQLGTVSVPLADLVDGKSRTSVDKGPLSEYRTAGFSINVHSYEGGFPVVACGDIPTG